MSSEELLRELSGAGRRDSSGTFTLDLARAIPLLARYQLPHRDRVVLRLLASAVASGATWFEYRPLSGGYDCLWEVELGRLWEALLGLNAVRGFGGKAVVDSGCQRLVVTGQSVPPRGGVSGSGPPEHAAN